MSPLINRPLRVTVPSNGSVIDTVHTLAVAPDQVRPGDVVVRALPGEEPAQEPAPVIPPPPPPPADASGSPAADAARPAAEPDPAATSSGTSPDLSEADAAKLYAAVIVDGGVRDALPQIRDLTAADALLLDAIVAAEHTRATERGESPRVTILQAVEEQRAQLHNPPGMESPEEGA